MNLQMLNAQTPSAIHAIWALVSKVEINLARRGVAKSDQAFSSEAKRILLSELLPDAEIIRGEFETMVASIDCEGVRHVFGLHDVDAVRGFCAWVVQSGPAYFQNLMDDPRVAFRHMLAQGTNVTAAPQARGMLAVIELLPLK